jgi:AraC-like DNA-binding protein
MDPMILLNAESGYHAEGVAPVLGLFCKEGRSQVPGNRAATSGILKLLFIEILRITMSNRTRENRPCAKNPLAPLFDPVLRKAAEAIHFEPSKPWTVADLADLSGLSRTSFAVHFQELTGVSPLAYLTRIRMLNAVDLLERSNDTLEAIAVQVGYGSEAAFSTAFKREMGVSPGAYRKKESVSGPFGSPILSG